jgi:hypothetical protein
MNAPKQVVPKQVLPKQAVPADLSSALSETPCWTSWNTARRLEHDDARFGAMPPSLLSALHRGQDVEQVEVHETAPARWPSASLRNTPNNKGESVMERDANTRYAELPTSPMNRIKCWLANVLAARATLGELGAVGEAEIGRIAHDFNMSATELRALAAKGPQAAALLEERLAQLGLDPIDSPSLDPAVARDLQRICSMCDARRKCAHELDAHDSSENWKDYCPNSQTLEAMTEGQKNNRAISG